MPKPTSESDLVMVLVVVGHLQKRSALQAEKADDFELGKTTAGEWPTFGPTHSRGGASNPLPRKTSSLVIGKAVCRQAYPWHDA
jgi:hypothetical protein